MVDVAFILAYIDPNSGGLLFQLLAAAFVLFSGLFFFFSSQVKMMFARLRRFVKEKTGKGVQPQDENASE
ncbi:MAG: hypothetical protein IPL78_01835 [Chloroflexi bacterium]|nr:hypothetical protein [Chloroflexota bacterium]